MAGASAAAAARTGAVPLLLGEEAVGEKKFPDQERRNLKASVMFSGLLNLGKRPLGYQIAGGMTVNTSKASLPYVIFSGLLNLGGSDT